MQSDTGRRAMTLGSLFDGSGGFPLAGALHGIEPLWASEVEPYPIAVTKTHFPAMKHLGSVTDIHGFEIPPVDVITFGSPCQDMSVAGKRKGMQHTAKGNEDTTRSGLFYEAIRIIREMREATDGNHPTFAVWENVPGAFSSNRGDDFRCVLEELARVRDESISIPRPASGKWNNAGEIVGDGFSIAWRVLDAQYWGVPQRRKRIYLVADFSGERAGKILFKCESVSGHSSQGGEAREGAAADAERGADGGGQSGCLNPWDPQTERIYSPDSTFQTMNANTGGGQNRQGVCYPLNMMIVTRDKALGEGTGLGVGKNEDAQFTLSAAHCHAVAFMAGQGAKARCYDAMDARCYAATRFAEYKVALPMLRTSGGDFGGGSEGIVVYPAVARCLTAEADASPCLDRGQNVVALDCLNLCANNVSATLQAKSNGGYSLNYQNPVVYDTRGNGDGTNAPTLTGDHENRVTDYTSIVCAATAQTKTEIMVDTSPALLAGHERPIVTCDSKPSRRPSRRYIVRRLIPTECTRLQGFPDCWGILKPKDTMTMEEAAFWENVRKTHAAINGRAYRPCKGIDALVKWYNKLHTDSAEYKMWGNGLALPCAVFVMGGIAEQLQGR